MTGFEEVTILPFQAEDQAQVKALILAGLGEHWGGIDPTLNPDLNNIQSSYGEATFLVAWHAGRIVGTGALLPRPGLTGEIVRMSVAADCRRRGIGRRILDHLVEKARSAGYRRLTLETTATWQDAVGFYLGYGFNITHYHEGDVYFVIEVK